MQTNKIIKNSPASGVSDMVVLIGDCRQTYYATDDYKDILSNIRARKPKRRLELQGRLTNPPLQ